MKEIKIVDDDMVELVIMRLKAMPENIKFHIGNDLGSYDKEALLDHVEKQDSFGKRFVKLQKEYIKSSIMGFSNELKWKTKKKYMIFTV